MKVAIRAGNTLADLENFNRVAIESIGTRQFVVGVRNSGRLCVLFALRPEAEAARVMERIQSALNSPRRVCVLSAELTVVDDDGEAARLLDEFNATRPSAVERIERAHTLTSASPSTPVSA